MMDLMGTKLPSSWTTSTLGAVANGILSGGTPSTKNEAFWRGSVPWITSKWLKPRLYLDSGEKFISEEAVRQSATTVVPRNNLIFATRVGGGKVAVNRLDLAIHERKHATLTALFRTMLHQLMTAQIRVHDLDLSGLETALKE